MRVDTGAPSSHRSRTSPFYPPVSLQVLAASNADRSKVELIAPPPTAPVGTRLTLSTVDVLSHPPDAVIDPKKKGNVWEKIKGGLKTDEQGRATWEGGVWKTAQGDCTSTLIDAVIS